MWSSVSWSTNWVRLQYELISSQSDLQRILGTIIFQSSFAVGNNHRILKKKILICLTPLCLTATDTIMLPRSWNNCESLNFVWSSISPFLYTWRKNLCWVPLNNSGKIKGSHCKIGIGNFSSQPLCLRSDLMLSGRLY